MRVALVSPYDLSTPGGVQAQVIGLAEHLSARGHRVVVLGTDHRRVVRLRVNGSVAPLVVGRLGVIDADVVHVHEPVTPIGWQALAGATPTVATFHADVTSRLAGLIRAAAPMLRRRLARPIPTAVSEVAAGPWRAIGLDPMVIPNGIAPPDPPTVERRPHRVVFVGRDEPRKGLAVLLAAWHRVHHQHPDAELVVVGADGPAGSGIRYLGRVDETVKWEVLAGAGVVCVPNLGNESFGIVGVEAMASGCATVASDLPAFRAVIGDAGRFAIPGDAASLAAHLGAVLGNPALSGSLAEKGRRRAERYAWDRVVDAYLATYATAVAERRPNRR